MPRRSKQKSNPNQLELFELGPWVVTESSTEPDQRHEVGPSASVENVTERSVGDADELLDGPQTPTPDSDGKTASYFLRSSSGRLLDVTIRPFPSNHITRRRAADSLTAGHLHTIDESIRAVTENHVRCLYTAEDARSHEEELAELGRKIKSYAPVKVPAKQWARIKDFVGALALEAGPKVSYEPDELLSVLSQHVAWCDVTAVPFETRYVFNRDVIAEFIDKGCAALSNGTKSNYRSLLFKTAEAVLPPDQILRKGQAIKGSSPSVPYSSDEITALLVYAENQTTNLKRHGALTLLSAGLGAGLAAEDLLVVRGADVVTTDGLTVVTVNGRRAREVIALKRWSERLQTLADAAGDRWLFLPNRNSSRRKATAKFIHNLSGYPGQATISTQRLRATWICHHLSIGTLLPTLVKAAGVTTLHPFARYLQFVPEVSDEVARLWLSGKAKR